MTRPTILFVPGAWHSPVCFGIVGKLLQDNGYPTSYVTLPSVGASPPLLDFTADVAKIKTSLQSLLEAGQEVMVVCHSYGGVPASEAIAGLDLASRQAQGLSGGVTHMFFCCAFLLPEGFSVNQVTGGQPPPWYTVSADGLEAVCTAPAQAFYEDLSDDQAEMIIATLRPQSYRAFDSRLTTAAWRVVPSTYLYCLRDAAIPVEFQRMMVEEFAKGVEIRTETLDTSHSPFWSKPDDVVASIRRAAGEVV